MDHRHLEVPPFWRSPAGIALLVATLVAGFYLAIEHRAHLFGVLPYLFLLACPLMHLFTHHDHGGHPHGRQPGSSDDGQSRQ